MQLFTRSAQATLFIFVAAAGLMSLGCDLGPDRHTPTGPVVTYSISGTVSEVTPSGLAPLPGAEVREEYSRVQAVTDSNGFYTLSGVYGSSPSVKVTRNWYVPQSKSLVGEIDARLDFQVDRVVTYVLSGVVFEVAHGRRLPVEDVELYCGGCGSADGHTYTYTDVDGFYSFSWVLGGTQFSVSKPGYRLADDHRRDSMVVTNVTSDTHLDVELVRN